MASSKQSATLLLGVLGLMLLLVPSAFGESSTVINMIDALKCNGSNALCGPIPVNCSFSSNRGSSWTEMTNQANLT